MVDVRSGTEVSRSPLQPPPVTPPTPSKPRTAARKVKLVRDAAPDRVARLAQQSAVAAPKRKGVTLTGDARAKAIAQYGVRPCGCVARGRHAAGCKESGRSARAKPAKKSASDDEDRGAPVLAAPATDPGFAYAENVRARARPSEAVTPGPVLAVIPQSLLVARLHADRANNAVGDAGGYVAVAEPTPSLVGHAETKREHCPVHGWVGRVAFEREGHEHCVRPELVGRELCRACEGRGWSDGGMCRTCNGDGVQPRDESPTPEPRGVNSAERGQVSAALPDSYVGEDGKRYRTRDMRGHDRADTIAAKHLTRAVIAEGWAEIAELDAAIGPAEYPERPSTRAECSDVPRPCPYVSCRYHMALDINPEIGSIKINFPDLEPWELTHSCALDAAELGPHSLDALGEKLNVTRERARQLEVKAAEAMQLAARRARIVPRTQRDIKPENVIDRDTNPDNTNEGATTP